MKILLSNDDGYNAEGLLKLALALKDRHEVHISAPAGEQSGSGHGLTFGRGLGWRRVPADELPEVDGKRVDVPCHAVYGSPADAVKFAIEHIYLGERFDLVISGVNTVLNIGSDIISYIRALSARRKRAPFWACRQSRFPPTCAKAVTTRR